MGQERRRHVAVVVLPRHPGDLGDPLEAALIEHGRLVRREDEPDDVVDLGDLADQLVIDRRQLGRDLIARRLHQVADFSLEAVDLVAALDQLEALQDQVALVLVQLLGLDQDVLADADLAEVVEHPGVLDLGQIVVGEPRRRGTSPGRSR